MNFFYQIYYSIVNAFSSPKRSFQSIAHSPPTTRSLIFGVPGFLIGLIAVSTALWAQWGGHEKRIARYDAAAEKSRDRAGQVIAILGIREKIGADTEIPNSIRKQIDADILEMDVAELKVKRKEYLAEWEIYLHKLIELDPAQDEWKLQLAEAANQQGKKELVQTLLLMLAPIDRPGNKKAQLSLGMNYMRAKMYDRAAKHFRNALQSDSQFTAAHFQLVQALVAMQEYNTAKKEIEKIFEDHLVEYIALLDLARFVYRQTDGLLGEKAVLNQAIVILREDIQNKENRKFWPHLLQCYSDLGNYAEAESLILWMQKQPNRNAQEMRGHKHRLSQLYSVWASKMSLQSGKYDPEKNFDLLKKSFTENPENPNALAQIAELALIGPEQISKDARALYDPTLDRDPPSTVHVVLSNFYLSERLKHQNAGNAEQAIIERDRAVTELRKAFDKAPNDNQIRNNLAYLLIQQGESRIDEALKLSEYAVETQRKVWKKAQMSQFYDTLASVQMAKAIALSRTEHSNSQKYFLDAIANFKKAQVGRPENIGILTSLANCHRAVKNLPAAERLDKRIASLKARDKDKNK